MVVTLWDTTTRKSVKNILGMIDREKKKMEKKPGGTRVT